MELSRNVRGIALDTYKEKLVYVTSYNKKLYEASGKNLIASFIKHDVDGILLAGEEYELGNPLTLRTEKTKGFDINNEPLLQQFLEKNKDIIPEKFGGLSKPCHCKNIKHHDIKPCHWHWFNRNAFRWYRKVVTLLTTLKLCPEAEYLIWIDCDCYFTKKLELRTISKLCNTYTTFYIQGRFRPVEETGIIGFNLKESGQIFIEALNQRYTSGEFRNDERWDDSFQYRRTRETTYYDHRDIIDSNHGPGARVVHQSALGKYIGHNKGSHTPIYQ